VGLLLLGALAVFTWLSLQVGALRSFGNTFRVVAEFDDAAGLVEDAAVKIAGVPVGAVESLQLDFDRARVVLLLNHDAGVRSDVRAEIRARSLLGEKYIALRPQSQEAPLLADGDVISNTVSGLDVDKIMTRFGPLLDQVNPEDVARIVKNLGEVTEALGEDAPKVFEGLNGLITRLNIAAEAAPELKEEVPLLVTDLRRLSWKLEKSLSRAERTLNSLDAAAIVVPDTAQKLNAALDQVQPSMDDLGRALAQSDEAIAGLLSAMAKLEKLDEATLRRLLREEGVLVRLRSQKK
tara:strand:- start:359 stop:1240 length:882 start_codon:yes stop_codon:yes gene_type:complete